QIGQHRFRVYSGLERDARRSRRRRRMTFRFINPSETAHILDAINNDPEFKLASRFFAKDILLVVGDSKCIIKVRDGVVTEVKLNPTFMNSWSFLIKGSEETWQK